MNHVQHNARPSAHLGWIDVAKGLTIVLVVILYANEWVESDANTRLWLQHVVDFAAPFRMPAFFLLSGLLLSRSIEHDWRTFLDRKVVHFAYFYLLWLTILVFFQAPWIAAEQDGWREVPGLYVRSLVHPYSMLWFIYLLPIFFVVTKLLRNVPPALVWTLAAALQIADPDTGIKVLDKFIPYYVFFYSGYVLAPRIFALARSAAANRTRAVAAFAAWTLVNAYAVSAGIAQAPGAALILGLLGACAVVAGCTLLTGIRADLPLAYCGRNSLVIYLGFYIPLVLAGKLVLSSGWVADLGTAALLAAAAGVCAPLVLHRLVSSTRAAFLFERPSWISAAPRRRPQRPAAAAT